MTTLPKKSVASTLLWKNISRRLLVKSKSVGTAIVMQLDHLKVKSQNVNKKSRYVKIPAFFCLNSTFYFRSIRPSLNTAELIGLTLTKWNEFGSTLSGDSRRPRSSKMRSIKMFSFGNTSFFTPSYLM